MSKLGEKVAYLKGLAEGLRLDSDTDQGKLLLAMIDAMDAFAAEAEEQEAELAELAKRDAQYAEEEAERRRILREGVAAQPRKSPTPGEKRLEDVGKAAEAVAAERWSEEEKRIVARMEPLICQALKDKNEAAAEAYLEALKSLVPNYTPSKK